MSNLELEQYVPETVTLRPPEGSSVPMPDPDLLRLHYQIAKILGESGIDLKLVRACGQTGFDRPGARAECQNVDG
jgi:hypothetical protein